MTVPWANAVELKQVNHGNMVGKPLVLVISESAYFEGKWIWDVKTLEDAAVTVVQKFKGKELPGATDLIAAWFQTYLAFFIPPTDVLTRAQNHMVALQSRRRWKSCAGSTSRTTRPSIAARCGAC